MKRVDQLYIDNEYKIFLQEINYLWKEYNKKISKLYKSPEEEAEKYEAYLLENSDEYSYVENIEDVLPEIERLVYNRYLLIKNIKYRYLCMFITTIYEMLEQFFCSLIKSRLGLFFDFNLKKYNKELYFKDIIDFYKDFNYEIKNNNYYKDIYELRLLHNVIKHGKGSSEKELNKINKKYFTKISSIYPFDDTIINDNLNLEESDFDRFVEAINNFIKEFPLILNHEYEVN